MLQRLLQYFGDIVFLLRRKWDKARYRQPPGPPVAQPPKPPFDWRRLKRPDQWRKLINESSSKTSLAAVVLLTLAALFIFHTLFPTALRVSGDIYFFDLATGELFAGPGGQLPPVDTPRGSTMEGQPAGVVAHVFSCGECSDPKSRYVGYLKSLTPSGKQALREHERRLQPVMLDPIAEQAAAAASATQASLTQPVGEFAVPEVDPNTLWIVRRGDPPGEWVPYVSEQGLAILEEAAQPCPGKKNHQFPQECFPSM